MNRAISWRSQYYRGRQRRTYAANLASSRRTPGAVLCPIPFLRPRDIITTRRGLTVLKNSSICWRLLLILSTTLCRCLQTARRSASAHHATGHLTTVGASKSDAVRDILLARWTRFRHKTFHQPTTSRRAYSPRAAYWRHGTCSLLRLPIPLSFDECGKSKYVHLVTFQTAN